MYGHNVIAIMILTGSVNVEYKNAHHVAFDYLCHMSDAICAVVINIGHCQCAAKKPDLLASNHVAFSDKPCPLGLCSPLSNYIKRLTTFLLTILLFIFKIQFSH